MATKMVFTVFASMLVMLALTAVESGHEDVVVLCNANENGASKSDVSVDITRVLTDKALPGADLCSPRFWGPWNCADILCRGTAQIRMCSWGAVVPCNVAGEYLNRVLAQCVTAGANGGEVVEGQVTINCQTNPLQEITYYVGGIPVLLYSPSEAPAIWQVYVHLYKQ